MLILKKSADRGYNHIDWLESFHSFSFGQYYDPTNINYSHLRVINEDKIAPHSGFGFHSHKNMEIITFMLHGNIEHRDNLGNIGILEEGNVQLMRAGTGITHSEMNNFDREAHLLQIWIHSNNDNLDPTWEEKKFNNQENITVIVEPITKTNQLHLLNDNIHGNGLKMAQNGYILKVNQNIDLNFTAFGTSKIYLHQAEGNSHLKSDDTIINLFHGDAAMGKIANNLNIKVENGTLLIFIFPQ